MGPRKRSSTIDGAVKSSYHICKACERKDTINDYGNCDECGAKDYYRTIRVFDDEEFASQFTSPTFRVVVGPTKKAYYLHKQVLIARMPYFKTMLSGSFKGTETIKNEVILDSAVDVKEAFDMAIEYAYREAYKYPLNLGASSKCLLNAQVYLLAERLCMEDLKLRALEKMVTVLVEAWRRGSEVYNYDTGRSSYRYDHKIDLDTLLQAVRQIYANTPGDEALSDGSNEAVSDGYNEAISDGYNEAVSDGYNEASPGEQSEEEVRTREQENAVEDCEKKQEKHDENPTPRTDKMRLLLSRYTASRMGEVKECRDFMALVRADGDLAKDLIAAMTAGDEIRSDELKRL